MIGAGLATARQEQMISQPEGKVIGMSIIEKTAVEIFDRLIPSYYFGNNVS
jgi:hypothetical protein